MNKSDNSNIIISTDRSLIDLHFVYSYLHEHMYWAKNMTFKTFEKAVAHSAIVLGVYDSLSNGNLVGFSRVISDFATFAYLTDVFIITEYRGKGLSKKMIKLIIDHPELQELRRFLLVTKDAQDLYSKFGFESLKDGANWMEIYND